MSKKKIVLAVAGVALVAGAAAAVSAPGHRDGWGHGSMMRDDAFGGMGKGGWFRGSVSKEQFDTRTRERFARFDKNGDNVIDPSEMEAVIKDGMSRRFGKGGRGGPMMGERMTRAFDANHDGKVTKDEVRAEFERRFAEADINSDGKIDDTDLPPMMRGRNGIDDGPAFGMRRGGRHGMMRGMGFLKQADANKDGVVTKDEVDALADRNFARMDWNKDGVVDKADREALQKETLDYAVKRMAHRMGAGADGKVTREQFQAKAAERFARLDSDGDGKLSRGEMPGHGHGMRGWHRGPEGKGPHRGEGHHGPRDGGPRGPGEAGEAPPKE